MLGDDFTMSIVRGNMQKIYVGFRVNYFDSENEGNVRYYF